MKPLARAAALLLLVRPAQAEEYGQWSWEAALAAQQRSYRNEAAGLASSRLDESDLTLTGGLNGFVFHPALAGFRLGFEAGLSRFDSTQALRTRRFGLSGNLNVLPASAYPASLFYSRQLYDYSQLTAEDPLALLGTPDTSTSFGGRLRLRRGLLRGTLLGYDHSAIDYRGEAAPGSRDLGFLDWGGSSARFQRNLRLDYRSERYALVAFRIQDLTGSFTQRGQLGPGWRSETAAIGIHRTLTQLESSVLDSLRISQSFSHPVGARDLLELSYDGGLTSGASATFQSHVAQARYRWRPSDAWTFSPLAGYLLQIVGPDRLQAPQLGLNAAWTGRRASTDLQLNGGITFLLGLRGQSRGSDSALGLSLGASAARGTYERLRTEVEGSWTRNRVRLAGEAVSELPDLGTSLAGAGTEDTLRGRLTFSHRIRTMTALLYSDASRSQPSGALARSGRGLETLSNTLQLAGRRFGLTGNLGESRVLGSSGQVVSFWGGSATLRPLRLLGLTGSYRADRRTLTLAPSVDGERWEANADAWVGAFVLRGQVFATTERAVAGGERKNRGLTLTLSRGFRGFLPFVTGGLGGGEIK